MVHNFDDTWATAQEGIERKASILTFPSRQTTKYTRLAPSTIACSTCTKARPPHLAHEKPKPNPGPTPRQLSGYDRWHGHQCQVHVHQQQGGEAREAAANSNPNPHPKPLTLPNPRLREKRKAEAMPARTKTEKKAPEGIAEPLSTIKRHISRQPTISYLGKHRSFNT